MALYINGELSTIATAEITFALPSGTLLRVLGVTSINYSDELTRALQYGTGSLPLGSARGTYKPTLDVELYKQESDRAIEALGDDYGAKYCNTVVTDRPKGGTLRTDNIPQCLITKIEDAVSGEDGRKVKWTLLPHGVISRGGKKLITEPAASRRLAIR